MLLVKSADKPIGHIYMEDAVKFFSGDVSVFRPFENWRNTFSQDLKKTLKLSQTKENKR